MNEILIQPTKQKLCFLKLKGDHGFKTLFASEQNEPIPRMFINDILGKKRAKRIMKLSLLLPEEPDHDSQKRYVPDALFKDEKENHYLIEMQQKRQSNFLQRLFFYIMKTAARHLKKGENYEKLKKTTVIAIVDYIMFGKKREYIHRYKLRAQSDLRQCIQGAEVIIVELPKFRKKFEEMKKTLENAIEHLTDIDRWWYNFEYINEVTEDELEQMKRAHQEIQQAILKAAWAPEEAAEVLAIREEMRQRDQKAYEDKLLAKGEAKGRKAGIKEGEIKGREEGKTEVINMFFKGGMDIHDIAKYIHLPLQEIEKLLSKGNR